METIPWIVEAEKELGVHEIPGTQAEPRIIQYWKDAGLDPRVAVQGDETPWCAAFAGAMLARAKIAPPHATIAKGFLQWGNRIDHPVHGCVAVLNRPGGESWQGHVGFFVGGGGGMIFLLAGNQGDKVSVARFPASRVAGYRWPAGVPITVTPAPAPPPETLSSVLAPTQTDPSDR